jgi:hypothetical protein
MTAEQVVCGEMDTLMEQNTRTGAECSSTTFAVGRPLEGKRDCTTAKGRRSEPKTQEASQEAPNSLRHQQLLHTYLIERERQLAPREGGCHGSGGHASLPPHPIQLHLPPKLLGDAAPDLWWQRGLGWAGWAEGEAQEPLGGPCPVHKVQRPPARGKY